MPEGGLNKDGGISFTNKRNFGKQKEEPVVQEVVEELEIQDEEYLARQKRLEAKLITAKSVNYSGFAFNGSSIFIMLYGINNIISDPNTLSILNTFNELFDLNIDFNHIVSKIEEFKAQLIGLCVSIQTSFMAYQDFCQKMKDKDTESFMDVLNEELDKI